MEKLWPKYLFVLATIALPFLICGQEKKSDFFFYFFNRDINLHTFPVETRSISELKAALLNGSGPRDPHGVSRYAVTKWRVRWQWPTTADKRAEFSRSTVLANVDIHVPFWSVASSLEASEWQSNYLLLLNHELAHGKNALSTATLIRDGLIALGNSGQNNPNEGNKFASKFISKARQWDVEYDRETSHGKNQGLD